ncbi:MAG: hypothetical protein ACE5F5_03040 [Acidimicrobiia bacterium]
MKTWRYITNDSVGGAEGLALDEALCAAYGRDDRESPTTLRLYTYRDHAALCGRFQHLEAEVDLDACQRTGTEFNRRPTGGGAIIMGETQLGVAVCAPAPVAESPKSILLRFSEGIVAGLATLGMEASFGGKNDLKVGGRKIAGLGLYLNGSGGLLFHASILADLDVAFMLDVLRIPVAKLGGAAVEAVERRVTTVSRETGRSWDGKALREVIADGVSEAMGVDLDVSTSTAGEEALAKGLLESKYGTDEWRFQRSPQLDATGTSMIKTPGGLVRLYLAMTGETIKSALFTGDFNELPPDLADLESRLKWSATDRATLSRIVGECLTGGSTLGVTNDEIVELIMSAARRAQAIGLAAPSRSGSCYFPETTEGVNSP